MDSTQLPSTCGTQQAWQKPLPSCGWLGWLRSSALFSQLLLSLEETALHMWTAHSGDRLLGRVSTLLTLTGHLENLIGAPGLTFGQLPLLPDRYNTWLLVTGLCSGKPSLVALLVPLSPPLVSSCLPHSPVNQWGPPEADPKTNAFIDWEIWEYQ